MMPSSPFFRRVRTVGVTSAILVGGLLAVAIVSFAIAPDGKGAVTRVLVNFLITVIIVVGLQTFTGNSGIPSYGHAAFVGLGAYVTAWFTIDPSLKSDMLPGLPAWLAGTEWGFLPALGVSIVAGGVAALLVGVVFTRMKETAFAMSTMALLVMAHGIFNNWGAITRGTEGIYALPVRVNIWIAFAGAAIAVVAAVAFKYSRLGLRLQASREDPLSAQTSGVSLVQVRLAAWVLSAVLCAAGGSLWAQYNLAMAPGQFYWALVLNMLSMLVIGGMATVSGAVVGAGLTTIVFQLLRDVEDNGELFGLAVPQVTGLTQMVIAVATLLILIYRRDGLLAWWELDGWARRARQWTSRKQAQPAAVDTPSCGGENDGGV